MSFVRRRATLLVAAALAGLVALSAFDPEGLARHRRLEAEVRRLAEENRAIGLQNARLRREVRALQGDPAALERAAREELGWVRQGEIVFKLDEGERR